MPVHQLISLSAQTAMEAGAEADAFAWSMLGIIGLAFGVVGMLGMSMRYHVRRRDAAVDELLDELEREQKASERQAAATTLAAPQREAWERDADWWRRDS